MGGAAGATIKAQLRSPRAEGRGGGPGEQGRTNALRPRTDCTVIPLSDSHHEWSVRGCVHDTAAGGVVSGCGMRVALLVTTARCTASPPLIAVPRPVLLLPSSAPLPLARIHRRRSQRHADAADERSQSPTQIPPIPLRSLQLHSSAHRPPPHNSNRSTAAGQLKQQRRTQRRPHRQGTQRTQHSCSTDRQLRFAA